MLPIFGSHPVYMTAVYWYYSVFHSSAAK